MFETHLTVVGTVITNLSRRHLADDTTVVSFRVASNERRFDRATGSWADGDSLYVSVTCWRQLAENVYSSFNMGDPIIVRGRLHSRSYEDKEGRRQTVTELEGLAVGPDLSRATARIIRLRRDGLPLALARGAEEDLDRGVQGDSGQGSEQGDRQQSDDPWRPADDSTDGRDADDREPPGGHRATDQAAVGA